MWEEGRDHERFVKAGIKSCRDEYQKYGMASMWGTAALNNLFSLEMQELHGGQRGWKCLRNHETSNTVTRGPQMKQQVVRLK